MSALSKSLATLAISAGFMLISLIDSEKCFIDFDSILTSSMKDDNECEACLTGPGSENGNNKLQEKQDKTVNTTSAVDMNPVSNTGVEAGVPEVEYIESENLNDIEDLDLARQNLLSALDSKDWVAVCEALNNVRRFSVFHREILLEMLENVIPPIVKSLKNPRSALCKTAIMTSSDIFSAFGDHIIDSLDPLLLQLLLKASQDKRFVCEAAERALLAMTTSVSATLLLPKLHPYLKNRNPRIRAKASIWFCKSVPRLGVEGIKEYGIDKLVQVAASQLSDKLPESRESARSLLVELRSVYEKSSVISSSDNKEQSEIGSWESFCQSKLPPLTAQAVLRTTNATREELVTPS